MAHLERSIELGVGEITPEHIASMDEVVLLELPEMNIIGKHRVPMFHTDFISGLYGNMFLSVGRQHQGGQKVFLWQLGNERPRGALTLAGDDIQAVALTQNGLAVATHEDKTIRLHNPSTGAVWRL
jgi:hypothetical protein